MITTNIAIMDEEETYRRLQILNDDKIREYTPAIIYVAIVVAFGVFGNIMSVTYYGFKCPRTPTNVIITGLGVVDLICCIILADEIIELCYTVTFKNVAGCKVMYFINHWLVFVAGNTLFFVGCDRYRKICQPFKWQFTVFRIKLAFLVIVGYSLAVSVRDFVILDVVRVNISMLNDDNPVRAFYCTHSDRDDIQGVITAFQIIDLITFVVVVGGSGVLYILIAIKLWKSRRRAHPGGGVKEETSAEVTTISNVDETSDPEKDVTTDIPDSIIGNVKEKSAIRYTGDVIELAETSEAISIPDTIANAGGERAEGVNAEQTTEGGDINTEINVDTDEEIGVTKSDNHNKINAGDNCNVVDKDVIDNSSEEKNFNKDTVVNQRGSPQSSPSKIKAFENKLNTIKKKVMFKASGLTAEMKVEQKVTIMMIVITSVSIISFVPYFVVNLGIKSNSDTSDQEFSVGIQIALRSYILNNAVNPYIIGMFNSQFRQFVKDLFLRGTCMKRAA